jgi:hypothetical protein
MVDVGIAVPAGTSAPALVQRLLGVSDAAAVSVDSARSEVRVHSDRAEACTVNEVLRTVADWLDECGVPAAQVRLRDRSYTLVGGGLGYRGPELIQ